MTWKGHGRITILTAVPAAAGTAYLLPDWRLALLVALGVLSGLFIDPDLDLTVATGSRWRASALSPELGWLWGKFWWLYGRIIPHRSVWSHLPLLGTAGRVGYLLLPFCVIMVAVGNGEAIQRLVDSLFFWAWFVGLALSDIGHWLADGRPVRW